MADVANEAGVSKGTPYLYFAAKETLYVALHDQWDCALGTRIDAAVREIPAAHQRSPRRVLRALVAAVGAHVTDDPQTCRVLMEARTLAAYQPAVAAAVQDAEARALRQLTGLIQAGITAGEWPAGTDPELKARLLPVDPAVAPFGVLPGQPEDQGLNVPAGGRPAGPAAHRPRRPAAPDDVAVPAQDRVPG
jgi:AcrR family transcriptional regulator